MAYQLPDISILLSLSDGEKIEVIDHLFEPCPTFSSFVLDSVLGTESQFHSYDIFIETARVKLLDYLKEQEVKCSISGDIDPAISKMIAAHPRLGAPKPGANTTHLSQHSNAEQKSLYTGSPSEALKLSELNELYEKTFPGLRYVVFVNGRPRSEIINNMEERIAGNNIKQERIEAFNAMCDIALDRAAKLGARH